MIVHQAVGVTEPVVAIYSLAEGCEEQLAVVVIFENVRPGVTSRVNVINSTEEFYA